MDRTFGLNQCAPSPGVLSQFVDRARRLYTLPAVALQVLELTSQPQVDTHALKSCIEKDPALTAKLLGAVNSSLFSPRSEISDLNQALAMLGVQPLKLLILGFSLPKRLFSGVEREVLQRYWRHTLIKAIAAREISQRVWKHAGDEPFVAALLQDIGILALVKDLGQSYAQFMNHVHLEGGELAELEIATLGFDHTVLSSRLLRHWQLPESIARAVAVPHHVQRVESLPPEERLLPQILHLAELVAQFIAQGRPQALADLLEVGGRYAELELEQTETLLHELDEKAAELADLFSVQLGDLPDLCRLLEQAHARLAEVADLAACDCLADARQAASTSSSTWEERSPASNSSPSPPAKPPTALGPAARGTLAAEKTLLDNPAACLEDPGLLGRVAQAVASCRRARCAVSLVLVEIDDFSQQVVMRGLEATNQLVAHLHLTFDGLIQDRSCHVQISDACFALVLARCERSQAVALSRTLIERFHDASTITRDVSLNIGVATLALPPKGYPPDEMIDAAQRCLYGARIAGGDSVKSISI